MATKIDIISGFLGAGKTTLIKKLLKEAYADEQVVLIENEFGEIGIDGGFLKEAGIQIREMNSGCICCSLVGDFGTSLKEVVDKYHPDRILIEPSGVGKLSDVIKAVQGVQGDVDIVLNSYTTVVDAKKCKMYMRNFGEFFNNQVEYAGAIIMSRTDIIDEKKAQQAMELLRGINAKAAIITTPIEKLDGKKILEVMEKPVSLEEELMAEEEVCPECGHVHEHGEHHHHDHEDECGCGHDHAHGDENVFGRKFFLRFGIGLAFFLAAVFLHEGTICTILYICAYLIFGYDVLLRAAKHIGQGKVFDENFLMSFSTIGALYLGEMAEAVFVMLFYQVGEAFQEYAVARSRKSITALLDIRPDFAHLIVDDEERKVDPSLVQVGDMILVKAGERIPLDGVITEGHAMLDTAALTGESLPRSVGAGDQVLSGCINMDGSLKVRVERGFGESMVMKILEMVENASAKKSKTEKFITRFARVYTPIVVLLAVLVAVLPPLAGLGKFSLWFGRALVFLVVSCPCALVLSVPLTYFAGIGAASKCGILVKGGGDLDTLSRLKTVVFDKTGTLTKGRFSGRQ